MIKKKTKKQRLMVLFTSDMMYKKYISKAGLHATRFVAKIYFFSFHLFIVFSSPFVCCKLVLGILM